MKVIFRISSNSYKKDKIADKKRCLLNALVQWPLEEFVILADHVDNDTRDFLAEYADVTGLDVQYIDGGSSAQSFRIAYEYAINFSDEEIIYLLEDDYLHTDYSRRILLEGIDHADYVSLVDYPDKYVPASKGGNPFIGDDGAEDCRVILTTSSHWRTANSTTCTFAARVKTLKKDFLTWKNYCFFTEQQTHPHDFNCWIDLRNQGKTLITPIPSLATHCDIGTLAPLVDWSKI